MRTKTIRGLLQVIDEHDAGALGVLAISERRSDVPARTMSGVIKALAGRDMLDPEAAATLDKLIQKGGRLVDHVRGYNSAGSVVTIYEHRDEVQVEGFDEFAARWEVVGHQLNTEVAA
jgi:hypothetical protein